MRYFANLTNDGVTVKGVFPWELEANPEYEATLPQPVDVTELDPRPEAFWTYDQETGTFSPPVEEVPEDV